MIQPRARRDTTSVVNSAMRSTGSETNSSPPDHEQVVTAGGGDLERGARVVLVDDVREVGCALERARRRREAASGRVGRA